MLIFSVSWRTTSYNYSVSEILLEEILHRMPFLTEGEVRQMINGPESFTPDGNPVLGQVPEVPLVVGGRGGVLPALKWKALIDILFGEQHSETK